ncbi:hypothetical protein EQG63_01250 [Flavobacterium amnicola]|uniref:Ig-like domain-containing protein n=2 Tax=Flavobacterium amnicola TaxID=2506422 RepID=A0A4Q1K4E4_9FLAO|nr:hypothetical protein EQG63_01250 [Flavobacterium amnicola]
MKLKLLLLLFIFTILNVSAQCPNNNTFHSNVSPTIGTTLTVNCIKSGEYITSNVITGHTYKFSLCDTNSGDDTVLTLLTDTGTSISFDDDFCAPYSEITWVANFTGIVRCCLTIIHV